MFDDHIRIEIGIEGLSPGLIMENPASMLVQDRKDSIPEPKEEARRKAYFHPKDGKTLVIPSVWFYKSIMGMSPEFKPEGMKTRVSLKRIIAGSLHFEPEWVPIGCDEYEVYVTSVVLQTVAKKPRIIRARPRVFPWRAEATMWCDPTVISPVVAMQLRAVLEQVGLRGGFGGDRPGKSGGVHGRFKVVRYERV